MKDLNIWLEMFIPEVSLLQNKKNKCSFELTLIQSNHNELVYNKNENQIFIYDNWNLYTEFPTYIAKFISQVFQFLFESEGYYFIHASAVTNIDLNKSIIFIGDYWQGKSTIIDILEKKGNYSVISGNRILMKNDKIISGVNKISFYNEVINKNMTFIEKRDNRYYYNYNLNNRYLDSEVKSIVIPQIDKDNLFKYKIQKNDATWYIFNKISTLIRGETLLFNGKSTSPSFDNDLLSQNRLDWIKNKLLSNTDLYIIGGPRNEISSEIDKLF